METGDHPLAEPSEDELRTMLEKREREQAAGWSRMRRISTRLLVGGFALAVIVFLSFGSNRDLIAALLRESPPESATAKPAEAVASPTMDHSDEAMLKRAAGIPLASDLETGGKLIDEADIRLAMELMNFMNVPDAPPAEPPAKSSATTPEEK